MKQKIPVPIGTIIRYIYKGDYEYSKVVKCDGEKCIQPLGEVKKGTKVVSGVWKGKNKDYFEPRDTIKLEEDYSNLYSKKEKLGKSSIAQMSEENFTAIDKLLTGLLKSKTEAEAKKYLKKKSKTIERLFCEKEN